MKKLLNKFDLDKFEVLSGLRQDWRTRVPEFANCPVNSQPVITPNTTAICVYSKKNPLNVFSHDVIYGFFNRPTVNMLTCFRMQQTHPAPNYTCCPCSLMKSSCVPKYLPCICAFKEFESEKRKVICKTLRFLAHYYGGSLIVRPTRPWLMEPKLWLV